jgi:uncharacterized surface protein with fasciclin (FAS1) repeats
MDINFKSKLISSTIVAMLISIPTLASATDCNYSKQASATSYSNQASQGSFIKVAAHAKAPMAQADIVDTAVSAGNFNTLVTAVKAAGLVQTLKGAGPYTVFAPTDEAFAKIPKAQLDALIADKDALKKVLLYHVVSGKVSSGDVVKLKSAKTAQGSDVMIDASSGVMINSSKVVMADVMTSNGIIHAIDTVLMPN